MIALATPQDLTGQTDVSRVEYFAVPTNGAQSVQVQHTLYPYEHYLQAMPPKELSGAMYQAGFQAGITMMQQQLGKNFFFFCFLLYFYYYFVLMLYFWYCGSFDIIRLF